MKGFTYSSATGGNCRSGTAMLGLATRPAFLAATVTSASAVEDDAGVQSGTVTENGLVRLMSDTEFVGVNALWADVTTLAGPTPVYAVNAEGVYQGAVTDLTGLTAVPSAAPSQEHMWVNGQWELPVVLADLQEDLLNTVDRAAGSARARYITVVPGQDATYVTKGQQALDFIANPTGPVPGYVAAEATATGLSALDAANLINNTAIGWGALGPQIEMLRRQGNIAVAAATTPVDALAAANQYITALSQV